jgi:hypothetical protein
LGLRQPGGDQDVTGRVDVAKVQLAFVTRYRRGVPSDEHLDALRACSPACSDFGADLVELDGADDQVHLLVT